MISGSLCSWILLCIIQQCLCRVDEWYYVPCDKVYQPENCDKPKYLESIDDYERCAPAKLELEARNYYLAAAGRKITYRENKEAFDRLRIMPKMMRDVSVSSLATTVLGEKMDFPIGLSPTALHKLAHPRGELATVEGVSRMRTVMILSNYASTKIEDVGSAARGYPISMWMQVYIYTNRSLTRDLIRRAERSGFKAIVVTADSNIVTILSCNERNNLDFQPGVRVENMDHHKVTFDPTFSFADITWLTTVTKLPIIVKGILNADDAVRAVMAGASAILVSNHGGRQLDGVPATIDLLPGIVDAVSQFYPPRDVYMDGGIRSGSDVYKAIARGAKMVFIGRPTIWGLTLGGSKGVEKIVTTLAKEFKETMLLSGSTGIGEIKRETVISTTPPFKS